LWQPPATSLPKLPDQQHPSQVRHLTPGMGKVKFWLARIGIRRDSFARQLQKSACYGYHHPVGFTKLLEKISLPLILAAVASAQSDPPPVSYIRISPILNAIDTNQDGVLSAAEIAASATALRKLDKNGDGELTRDEAGIHMDQLPGRGGRGDGRGRGEGRGEGRGRSEGGAEPEIPAPPPSADDMTTTLMMFDANHNGQLEKSEVPERFQGLFERGDTNKDGILTKDEITALAQASRQMKLPPRPNRFDLAMSALDANGDGELSAAEIDAAPKALLALDKNGDGQITNDEVTPPPGRGPGGRGQ
jgi:Ca2+-binding EF-hand superfamily protein